MIIIIVVSCTVTLVPDLEALAGSVYFSVAKQLPQMLRQWYLSLDRQTSVPVNRCGMCVSGVQILEVSIVFMSHARTHACTHARTRAHTHTHTVLMLQRLVLDYGNKRLREYNQATPELVTWR